MIVNISHHAGCRRWCLGAQKVSETLPASAGAVQKSQRAWEKAGVVFVAEDGDGPGVRLKGEGEEALIGAGETVRLV